MRSRPALDAARRDARLLRLLLPAKQTGHFGADPALLRRVWRRVQQRANGSPDFEKLRVGRESLRLKELGISGRQKTDSAELRESDRKQRQYRKCETSVRETEEKRQPQHRFRVVCEVNPPCYVNDR